MNENVAQGPLLPDRRVEFPQFDAYVEFRNVRWPSKVGYEIEHGSLRFGHRGTWGRNSLVTAIKCFDAAVDYLFK